MNIYFKKSFLTILVLFLPAKILFSQEQDSIKKIIIDTNQNKRLLIPSIENENEKIQLIPPKSMSDSETKKNDIEKEIEAARKVQEEKRKAIEEKRKKRLKKLEELKNKKEKL